MEVTIVYSNGNDRTIWIDSDREYYENDLNEEEIADGITNFIYNNYHVSEGE